LEAVERAVLDYKLIDGMSLPVADALMERGVPFLFASAYDPAAMPPLCLGALRGQGLRARASAADDRGSLQSSADVRATMMAATEDRWWRLGIASRIASGGYELTRLTQNDISRSCGPQTAAPGDAELEE
jgi:hypothetical protein